MKTLFALLILASGLPAMDSRQAHEVIGWAERRTYATPLGLPHADAPEPGWMGAAGLGVVLGVAGLRKRKLVLIALSLAPVSMALILLAVMWLPCKLDPIICGGPPLPWWFYAVTFILALKPALLTAVFICRNEDYKKYRQDKI